MTQHTASPLSWPHGWPRTGPNKRKRAPFHGSTSQSYGDGVSYKRPRPLTISEGYNRLEDELRRMGARGIILSTNLRLKNDGLPFSGQKDPVDPGAAVYFTLNGKERVLAVDKWDRCPDNIAALAKTVEAMRGLERWGVGNMEQRFSGYKALPEATCWSVLGLKEGATHKEIESAYRELARKRHPDAGGSHDQFVELGEARKQAINYHD